jgi:uncharacterized protein YceH (UPF0502 family)
MAELLLRGPQTVGELRSRCSRMATFVTLAVVSAVLDSLAHKDPPMATALPREPGRAAIRHTHLLYPEGEQPAAAAQPGLGPTATVAATAVPSAPPAETDTLQSQIDALQTELADLHEAMNELRRRLESLETQLR